jgi:hypothetical protein
VQTGVAVQAAIALLLLFLLQLQQAIPSPLAAVVRQEIHNLTEAAVAILFLTSSHQPVVVLVTATTLPEAPAAPAAPAAAAMAEQLAQQVRVALATRRLHHRLKAQMAAMAQLAQRL